GLRSFGRDTDEREGFLQLDAADEPAALDLRDVDRLLWRPVRDRIRLRVRIDVLVEPVRAGDLPGDRVARPQIAVGLRLRQARAVRSLEEAGRLHQAPEARRAPLRAGDPDRRQAAACDGGRGGSLGERARGQREGDQNGQYDLHRGVGVYARASALVTRQS